MVHVVRAGVHDVGHASTCHVHVVHSGVPAGGIVADLGSVWIFGLG